jgi:hypothetical protein
MEQALLVSMHSLPDLRAFEELPMQVNEMFSNKTFLRYDMLDTKPFIRKFLKFHPDHLLLVLQH